MVNRRCLAAMTIPEVLFAMILLTITFLSLMAVLASGLRSDKKGFVKDTASATAELLLQRTCKRLSEDPAAKASFWATEKPNRETPYDQGEERSGDTVFRYEICTTYVRQADGSIFNAPNQRLMRIDVYVRWGEDDSRVGYGSMMYHGRRIVSEVSVSAS